MATATVNLNMPKAAYVDSRNPDATTPLAKGDTVTLHRNDLNGEMGRLYLGFGSFSSSLKRKKLIRVSTVGIYLETIKPVFVHGSLKTFNKNTLTWNNRPSGSDVTSKYYSGAWGNILQNNDGWSNHPERVSTRELSELAKAILKHSCLYIYPAKNDGLAEYETTLLGLAEGVYEPTLTPFITVEYDDGADLTSQITALNNTSGYLNPAKAQTFKWDFLSSDANYVCAGDFAQASAIFCWKNHSDNSYTQVNISGTTKSVTIPANTFPSNATIDWYVQGTDEDGTTTQTSVYSISTEDAQAIATVQSPMNTVEDGSGPITFKWNLSNAYGNEPSLVNLWWKLPSEDNQSWHVIVSSSDPITEYTVPAGTFPAGEIQWLVHAYNQDNDRGPDSQSSFVCVAAPGAPSMIASDGVPYATITWQCEGQQAYQIAIDGVDYGVRFGTAKSFTLDEPLEDGDHSVTITAQGVYGLWSQPGTAVITAENAPGEAITLTGTAGADAALTWETEEETADFFIYRDGVKIGHTTQTSFIDRLALGAHNYYVINRLPDGNYSKADSITLTLQTDAILIAAFPPEEWLNINLTENSSQSQNYSFKKTMTTRHVYGAAYPVMENSGFEDLSGSYDTAFIDAEQAQQFETLKGKAVCLKSRNGTVFVGAMASMQKKVTNFFTSYTFTLTRIHWEDYVDADALT